MGVAIFGITKEFSEGTMKYCSRCGAEINDAAVTCVKCGNQIPQSSPTNYNDQPSGGYAFLCFLIPILGLILYLVWKDTYPLKAKSCGKGALIGVIVGVVLGVLVALIYGVFVAGLISAYF